MLNHRMRFFCFLLVPLCAYAAARPQSSDNKTPQLPTGAIRRLGTLSWHHAERIGFAAFIADGKSVVSVSDDRIIRLWEYPSGSETRRIVVPKFQPRKEDQEENEKDEQKATVSAGAVSSDGKALAIYFAGEAIRLFDLAAGKETHVLTKPAPDNHPYKKLLFNNDGTKLFASMATGAVEEWDVGNGKLLQTLGKNRDVSASIINLYEPQLSFSPDGKTLLMWGDGKALQILDVATSAALPSTGEALSALIALQFIDGGNTILTLDRNKSLRRWNAADGRRR
jgi:WD40 repeat protein